MTKRKCTLTLADLPDTLPVFPLGGALLLPRGELPLNIFEDRYLVMVDDALAAGHRLIGMIQPRSDGAGPDALFATGCAGRISSFTETDDHRYLVTLSGVCRFNIRAEIEPKSGYRRVVPDFSPYECDLCACGGLDIDRDRLHDLLKQYFQVEGLSCNWENIKGIPDDRLITALAMVCPFSSCEKQALIEACDSAARAKIFMTMLDLAVREGRAAGTCGQGKCH